jgi:hypothetical protein
MRDALVQLASLLVATGVTACGGKLRGSTASAEADGSDGIGADGAASGRATTDAGIADAAADAVECDGPCCPPRSGGPSYAVTSDVACGIMVTDMLEAPVCSGSPFDASACTELCGIQGYCDFSSAYVQSFSALNPAFMASCKQSPPIECPPADAGVCVTCSYIGGRLTSGFPAPRPEVATDGERFAVTAWLEAVSVYAFERLERELATHGAPPELLRGARRARRDEARHTAMVGCLARRRGVNPRLPEPPPTRGARSLREMALENAVEGCVRETYAAVAGLVESITSPDPSLRRTMRSISRDEAFHAELAWKVHAWAMPRLDADERRRIREAMCAAVDELGPEGGWAASWAAIERAVAELPGVEEDGPGLRRARGRHVHPTRIPVR